MSVVWTQVFKNNFCNVLHKYASDEEKTEEFIDNLDTNYPTLGNPYPGLRIEAKKFRLPLKSYNIGKSGGLRLIASCIDDRYIPVFIYKKGKPEGESKIKRLILKALNDILEEIESY